MDDVNPTFVLDLKHITKRFGDLVAVSDVSFSLQRGRLVTFVGPSGCGKTTLLRVISGFVEPDEGQIVLDGKDITRTPPNTRDTAMVFQNYALFPHMTVAGNIGFGLQMSKKAKPEIKQEVAKLLDLVQLEGLGERRPHELSGGQQQRVALARALSLHPKILLLDEPLSNLDANLRVSMREEIRKLQRRLGLSIIFVTHDQEEAMSISDLLVVMDRGAVRQIGSPIEIYERPTDDFVANFVGHINFFPGRVKQLAPDKMRFETAIGTFVLSRPGFEVSENDALKAVVRPESIDIRACDADVAGQDNVVEGRVTVAMYIGSIMRYKIIVADQTVYVDEADPQYCGIFAEGSQVRLIFQRRIHMLRV